MTPYTVPISEEQTQVLQLIDRTKSTRRPLLLTREASAEPMAVLLEIDDYTQTQLYPQRLYHLQLSYLKQWLDRVELQWADRAIRKECVEVLQNSMKALWDVTPKSIQQFCVALGLSVKHLTVERFSLDQVRTLRFCLELLRDTEPNKTELDKAYQLLFDNGIPPMIPYDNDKLLPLYLDEL